MFLNHHGGGCCGIRHLYGFFNSEANEKTAFRTRLREAPFSRLIEVVLTEAQCQEAWRMKMLKDAGFVPVNSFINGNTRRRCYVFHGYKTRSDLRTSRFGPRTPPNWDTAET